MWNIQRKRKLINNVHFIDFCVAFWCWQKCNFPHFPNHIFPTAPFFPRRKDQEQYQDWNCILCFYLFVFFNHSLKKTNTCGKIMWCCFYICRKKPKKTGTFKKTSCWNISFVINMLNEEKNHVVRSHTLTVFT